MPYQRLIASVLHNYVTGRLTAAEVLGKELADTAWRRWPRGQSSGRHVAATCGMRPPASDRGADRPAEKVQR